MICPICSQTTMSEIWYGSPDQEMIEMAKRDEIVLGGFYKKPYTHFCSYCQETYPTPES